MNKINFSLFHRIRVARIFFILSALYGLFLRFYKISDLIPATYKHVLEGHSHVAFLGWGFLAVISLIDYAFLNNYIVKSNYLKSLFVIMTISVFAMLISFPLQGYKFFSIFFLSIFLLSSYLYLFKVLQLLRHKNKVEDRFIKTGIYFYFLSGLAVWSIGIISASLGKGVVYHNTIYFYLHFLYNGFFVFTLFGLFFKYISNNRISVEKKGLSFFFYLNLIACIPAYFLSLLWTKMPNYVYVLGFIAGFLQLIALFSLFKILKKVYTIQKNTLIKNVILIVFISYFIKVIVQFLSVFTFIMQKAIQLKPYFIIGYLHLFTLGFMSMFIILLILLLPKVKLNKIGVYTLSLGIVLSELFLFLQGLLILNFKGLANIDFILFTVSSLMPIGILIIHFKHKNPFKINNLKR